MKFDDFELKGKALWLKKQKILVIADLHIGYEFALASEGFFVPQTMFKEMFDEIKGLVEELKPKKVIINGDLKHEFGEISRQEWRDTLALLDYLLKRTKVILIKGNHDTILEPIARKKGLSIVDYYVVGNFLFLHGHKIFVDLFTKEKIKKIKNIVIGHDHPAVSFRDIRIEKYKCWLIGKWKNKKLIVMPSFMPLPEGSDITKEKMLSPFLSDIKNFDVYVVADKIYYFDKVKNI